MPLFGRRGRGEHAFGDIHTDDDRDIHVRRPADESREHFWAEAHWTLHAAAQLGWTDQPWPNQYLSGKGQLERNLKRQQEMLGTATI